MADENVNDQVDESAAPAAPAPIPAPVRSGYPTADDWNEEQPDTPAPVVEDAQAGDLPDALSLPEEAPQSHQFSDEARANLGTLSALSREQGIGVEDTQSLVNTFYSYESVFQNERLDPLDPDFDDRLDNVLRRHWGTGYDASMANARQAFRGLSQKTQDWLVETGALASPSVLSILAGMGKGYMKLSATEAGYVLKKFRAESVAFNESGHPNRKAALLEYRMLANLAARNDGDASERRSERDGKQALKDRRTSPKANDPRVKYESEAKALMRSEAWSDKRNPAHKEVARRVAELMRLAYPE